MTTGRAFCPIDYTQIMLIKCIGPHTLAPIGRLVKFTICERVCHVEDRMSNLFIGQMEFDIPQLRSLPTKRSTCIPVAAMSKFAATSLSENWSFSFCFGLFKVVPITVQSSCLENPRSLITRFQQNKLHHTLQ